jgi:hypothetical protein
MMSRTPRSSLLVLGLVLSCAVSAHEPLPPGLYLTERGWGRLTLAPPTLSAQRFSIEAVGSNSHHCSLAGEVHAGLATLAADADKPCRIGFRRRGPDILVEAEPDGPCQSFCGARASFPGLYLKPSAGCLPTEVAQRRRRFQQLYDRKAFGEARVALQPVLTECKTTLAWIEEGRIRNDLAVTLHKLQAWDECREVLAPYAKDAARRDEDIRSDYPPSDAESYLPVVRAARTNLRLCKAG